MRQSKRRKALRRRLASVHDAVILNGLRLRARQRAYNNRFRQALQDFEKRYADGGRAHNLTLWALMPKIRTPSAFHFCLLCLRHDCKHFEIPPHLTPKEVICLNLLTKGYPYPRIAKDLKTTPGAIRVSMIRVHRKLNVHSKGELIAWAVENKAGLKAAQKAIESGCAPG